MARPVSELLVFLASPGDVEVERSSVREVEQRINAMFEHRGVRVRVAGWEHVPPEAGRPQGLINPLVHQCDVFVGLLNRRWGSETGEYSSGFEEEFGIAIRRRDLGDKPAIGMFFAELPPDAVADPGAQLQAVLAFQDRVRAERIALYKQYRGPDHLAMEVLTFLTLQAMALADEIEASIGGQDERRSDGETGEGVGSDKSGAGRREAPGAADPVSDTTADLQPPESDTNSARRQISGVLRSLADTFDGADTNGKNPNDLDRVTLVGTAFARDEQTLGGHHVNRLYRRRDDLKLTNGEVWTWMRTYFADRQFSDRKSRTIPIWGIFHPLSADGDDIRDEFADMAVNANLGVCRGALGHLTDHRIRPPKLWPQRVSTPAGPAADETDETDETDADDAAAEELAAGPLAGGGPAADINALDADADPVRAMADPDLTPNANLDGTESVETHLAATSAKLRIPRDRLTTALATWSEIFDKFSGVDLALNYVVAVATPEDRPFLDAVAGVGGLDDSSRDAVRAFVAALSGDHGPLAQRAPSSYATGVNLVVEHIAKHVEALDPDGCVALLTSRNSRLAAAAAVQLIQHGRVDNIDLTGYLKLNDHDVDDALVARSATDTNLCGEIVGLLRGDKDFDNSDQRASRMLAAAFGDDILEPLSASEPYSLVSWEAMTIRDPASMLEVARQVLDGKATLLDEKVAPLQSEHKALARFVINNGRRAACTVLERVADPDDSDGDLQRVVDELRRDQYQTRDAALRAVVAMVSEATAGEVPVNVIDGYWVHGHVTALLASPLAPLLVPVWRESESNELRRAAEVWFITRSERVDSELEEALYLDQQEVRMAAIDEILQRWDRCKVERLLARYDQQERPYWYNVIAAIDEHLYGFTPVK